MKFGKWKEVHGYVTPGGDPVFACGLCGGSEHVHGVEHPRRKTVCDNCGQINSYPWEKTYEEEERAQPEDDLPRLKIEAKLYIPIGRRGETPEALDARFMELLDEIGAEFTTYPRDVVDIDGESLNYEWKDIENEEE